LAFKPAGPGSSQSEAAAYLTKFVFYFALSAMLFRFAANLSAFGEIFDWQFVGAYLSGVFRRLCSSPPPLPMIRQAPRR
jgi:malonate transporter